MTTQSQDWWTVKEAAEHLRNVRAALMTLETKLLGA
jgi:hypothetical protein